MTLLEAREQRSLHIKELSEKYNKPVITIKGNVVGVHKNPPFIAFVLRHFKNEIETKYKNEITYETYTESLDGNYYSFVVNDTVENVKENTITLEQSKIGRLIDLDVYYLKTYSRSDFARPLRKCLICDKSAFVCARSKNHKEEDILNKMEEISQSFLVEYLLNITDKAIKTEVDLYPKFGLVSKADSGCHKDMDYNTFIKSKNAINNGIKEYINQSFTEKLDHKKLIQIGINTEQAMFQATNNINTHKGLIFLLGIFLPVITNSIYSDKENNIEEDCAALSNTVIGDYYKNISNKPILSNSDIIYIKHGIKGIRDEALNGLKKITNNPTLKTNNNHTTLMNDLLYFMSVLNDTTIIHKNNIDLLTKVKNDSLKILNTGGYQENQRQVLELSNQYKSLHISPGGSADMLVIMTIYRDILHLLNN